MSDYSKTCYVAILILAILLIGIMELAKQIRQGIRNFRYRRLFSTLQEQLSYHSCWSNFYEDTNLAIHTRALVIMGIIAPRNYKYHWEDLSNALGIESWWGQPKVQRALCQRICQVLDIEIDKHFLEGGNETRPQWNMIAEKIDLKGFEAWYQKQLPIPFIIHAFTELFPYLEIPRRVAI